MQLNDIFILKSPDYPISIRPNLQCSWLYILPIRQTVRVKVRFLDLTVPGFDCNDTYVSIFEGEQDKSKLIKSFCNESAGYHMIFRASRFLVLFKSGVQVANRKGIELSFQTSGATPTSTITSATPTPTATTTTRSPTTTAITSAVPTTTAMTQRPPSNGKLLKWHNNASDSNDSLKPFFR